MQTGLVNLNNLFEDPKGKSNNNNQNRFGNNNYRNNSDDLFRLSDIIRTLLQFFFCNLKSKRYQT